MWWSVDRKKLPGDAAAWTLTCKPALACGTRFAFCWSDTRVPFGRPTRDFQTAALADGKADPRQAGQRLGRIDGKLQDHLHDQHGIEDRHYIPSVTRLEQRLAAGFDLLESDHHALDAQLAIFANQANAVHRLLSHGKSAKGEVAAFDGGLSGWTGSWTAI